MTTTAADVEIIIVNFNTRPELEACLSSLDAAPPACAARIVVVDNASGDGSVAAVRSQWPTVDVIALDRNIGFGAANNVALRQCQFRYAVLLNSDTQVRAGAIDRLRERMIARGAVAAGPRLVDGRGRPEVSFGRMLSPLGEAVQRWRLRVAEQPKHWASGYLRRYLGKERFVDWASGACLLLDVGAASAAGFFDERYFMYEEDVDLCAALRRAGGRILFTPEPEVTHLGGRSVRPVTSTTAGNSHYDRSHVAFYEKHAPHWAAWLRLWLRLRGRPLQ